MARSTHYYLTSEHITTWLPYTLLPDCHTHYYLTAVNIPTCLLYTILPDCRTHYYLNAVHITTWLSYTLLPDFNTHYNLTAIHITTWLPYLFLVLFRCKLKAGADSSRMRYQLQNSNFKFISYICTKQLERQTKNKVKLEDNEYKE